MSENRAPANPFSSDSRGRAHPEALQVLLQYSAGGATCGRPLQRAQPSARGANPDAARATEGRRAPRARHRRRSLSCASKRRRVGASSAPSVRRAPDPLLADGSPARRRGGPRARAPASPSAARAAATNPPQRGRRALRPATIDSSSRVRARARRAAPNRSACSAARRSAREEPGAVIIVRPPPACRPICQADARPRAVPAMRAARDPERARASSAIASTADRQAAQRAAGALATRIASLDLDGEAALTGVRRSRWPPLFCDSSARHVARDARETAGRRAAACSLAPLSREEKVPALEALDHEAERATRCSRPTVVAAGLRSSLTATRRRSRKLFGAHVRTTTWAPPSHRTRAHGSRPLLLSHMRRRAHPRRATATRRFPQHRERCLRRATHHRPKWRSNNAHNFARRDEPAARPSPTARL